MFNKPTAFMVEANGPDLTSAKVLPPASSLDRSLDAGISFSRQGLRQEVQERLIGVNRKLDIPMLEEILSCSRQEENMMFAAAAQMLSPAGPSQSLSPSPFGGIAQSTGVFSTSTPTLSSRRGMELRPNR